MTRITVALCSLLIISAAALPAHPQDPMSTPPTAPPATRPDGAPPESAEPADRPLLAGPRVEQEAMGDAASSFGARRRPTPPVPLAQWRRALGALSFTPAQRERMAAAVDVFIAAQRDFEQTYGQEVRSLRQEIRQSREAGRDVPAQKRQRIAELESQAPNILDMQRQVWSALTAEQQSSLREALAAMRERARNDARQGRPDMADRDGPG